MTWEKSSANKAESPKLFVPLSMPRPPEKTKR